MDLASESDFLRISCSPIHVEITPVTNYELKNVVQCDLAHVKHVLHVFTSACLEIRALIDECRKMYMPALCMYNSGRKEKRRETEVVRSISQFLPLIKDLLRFIRRCDAAVHHLISLVYKIYYEERPSKWKTSQLHLPTVFDSLARILGTLLLLEVAIEGHPNLKEDWNIYSDFIKTVCKNQAATDAEKVKIKVAGEICKALNAGLFNGSILKHCAVNKGATNERTVNNKFMRQFSSMTRAYALKADNLSYECDMEKHITCACALFCFGNLYFGRIDRKLLSFFWKRLSKVSSFTVCCNTHWQPCEFLYQRLPDIKDIVDISPILSSSPKCTMDFSSSQIFDLAPHELISLEVMINSMCRSEIVPSRTPRKFISILFRRVHLNRVRFIPQNTQETKTELPEPGCSVISVKALQLSMEVKHQSQRVISNWFKSASVAEKYSIEKCVRCLKAIKAMQRCLLKNQHQCAEFLFESMHRVACSLLKMLVAIKPSLISHKRYSTVVDSMVDALNAGLHVLSRPLTVESWIVLNLAFSFGLGDIVPAEQMKLINGLMDQMSFIINYHENFRQCFDCSFLMYIPWWKLTDSLTLHYGRRGDYSHSQTFFYALNDHFSCASAICRKYVNCARLATPESDILNSIGQNYLVTLAHAVENNLRFSLFGNSQQDTLVSAEERLNCRHMLWQLPFRIGARVVNINNFVRRRLDENFYNLCTVASYDWQSYTEMRHLAKYELRMPMNVPCLPCCDRRLDIVNMLRQFENLIGRYTYNLDDQYFIEKVVKSKCQNRFGLQHAVQSIRTHGLGVLSTIVNVAYKFLANKMRNCLQLMVNPNVKSRLIKEMHFIQTLPSDSMRMVKALLSNELPSVSCFTYALQYPYVRADALEQDFKSNTDADGQSDLDRFRILLTEIGNALGYVRLVRSAGFYVCVEGLRLLPDCEVDTAQTIVSGATNLVYDLWIELLSRTSEWQQRILKHQDWFKLLMKTFATEFRGEDLAAIECFYSLIPALTLNFAGHCLVYKESVQRYHEGEMTFSDDGFAIGTAFLLNVLGQLDHFTSLRWFASVSSKISSDKEVLMKEVLNSSDKTLQQTASFRIRRKEEFEQELRKASDALTSSRVLFRADMSYELVSSNSLGLAFTEGNSWKLQEEG